VEGPPPAEQVGEPAGHEQQRGEHDQVGRDHPGQAGVRDRREAATHGGEGDGDDRAVQEDDEQRRSGHREDLPPAAGIDGVPDEGPSTSGAAVTAVRAAQREPGRRRAAATR
jgi:hypothetical protein